MSGRKGVTRRKKRELLQPVPPFSCTQEGGGEICVASPEMAVQKKRAHSRVHPVSFPEGAKFSRRNYVLLLEIETACYDAIS